MYKKKFYSRRVVDRRHKRLHKSKNHKNYIQSSSSNDDTDCPIDDFKEFKHLIDTSIPSMIYKDFNTNQAYDDDVHDNTNELNDFVDNSTDYSSPLYRGCKYSTKKSTKMLLDFLISQIHLDKKNIIGLIKLIKLLLPIPNKLPTSWKKIKKLFGTTTLSFTTFLCANCLNVCKITSFNTKNCSNNSCRLFDRTLKTSEIVEIVHLDIRSQIKLIINRNINLLQQQHNVSPSSDVTSGSFYRKMASSEHSNTVTLILHSDGAPLVRSTKQSIWPFFASIVELPPPVRDYQANIILLSLWSSKRKPDVNVFLEKSINDIERLINHGTVFYINNMEYRFLIRIQLFVSDLPARALMFKTTHFNGYYACHYCVTKGHWSGSSVIYPYDKNNLELRTHVGFTAAANEAKQKSTNKRTPNIQGVKGFSCLLKIISYPRQIVLDYMHLVCLGHVQSLIKRWCQLLSSVDIMKMDNMLSIARFPHNVHVIYNESILNVESWKAKHGRLFVLNLGIPIGISCLPVLNSSHWIIYCLLVKLLHTPESSDDIDFADMLINYYCRTIANVYDESLELYSLHAHLHLPSQVRLHGGLSTSSAFAFESCIRYLKTKVHGTKHLASQIAYWYDIQSIVNQRKAETTTSYGVNEINLQNECISDYRDHLVYLIQVYDQDLKQIAFFRRFKQSFNTFHTLIYDKPYRCRSYIISYSIKGDDPVIQYGNIILFYKYNNNYFAFIQKYRCSRKQLSQFVELPIEICNKLNEMYPLLELTNEYDIIRADVIRHKCVMVNFQDVYCLSELKMDFEHD
ncbi:unnamed protein product [Rotaria socialis]|uniref:Ubiquitin-like protease family profile domain-containing protein n=3 Tax=Rotaria socialis TaxID=392032 RepID=A0A817UD18_9BILA|nr:unnamed protein product [Rotaria socialis]CAF4303820.1 unnamed protein product [Rotaria socialis]CAF4468016.1 unnamed protein product [Rotaria socialis]